jgi:hypothetical protein
MSDDSHIEITAVNSLAITCHKEGSQWVAQDSEYGLAAQGPTINEALTALSTLTAATLLAHSEAGGRGEEESPNVVTPEQLNELCEKLAEAPFDQVVQELEGLIVALGGSLEFMITFDPPFRNLEKASPPDETR